MSMGGLIDIHRAALDCPTIFCDIPLHAQLEILNSFKYLQTINYVRDSVV